MSDPDDTEQFVPVELVYEPPHSEGQAPLSPAASRALQGSDRARTALTSRHQRACHVCRHPAREAIEHDYLDWRSPSEIAIQYEFPDRASIDRHARAAGLLDLRRHNVRAALERLIERAEEADVTGTSIVSAVRTYLRITDDGQLVEPPTHVHFSVARFHASAPSRPARRPPRRPEARQPKRLSRRRLYKPRKRDRK